MCVPMARAKQQNDRVAEETEEQHRVNVCMVCAVEQGDREQ